MTRPGYWDDYYSANKEMILLKNELYRMNNRKQANKRSSVHYYSNLKENRRKGNEYKHTKRAELRRLLRESKNKPCVDCLGWFEYYQMHFDHRDPTTKEFNISRALSCAWSSQRILKEITKCDVVCANCHATRTFKQRESGII